MSEQDIIDILIKFREQLEIASFLNAPVRVLAWFFILGISKGVDLLSGALEEVYSLINFYDSPEINDFIDKYIGVIFLMGTLALVWLGWKIIVINETDLKKVVTNSLVAITIFLVLPWSMVQAEKLVTAAVDTLDDGVSKSSKIFKSNITDIYALDNAEWKSTNPKTKNFIEDDVSVDLIDITEVVNTGGFFTKSPLSDNGKEILTQKLVNSSGTYDLADLESNLFTDDEAYYRYSWHPVYMTVELITLFLVLTITLFKTAQLIIELGVLKVFSQITVFTDIESGQRNKKVVEKIKNTFIILFVIMALLNMYLIFVDFVTASDISKPVQLVVLIAAGIFVIDGPNFIEEFFGIDAGLKSIGRSLIGLAAGVKTAQTLATGAGKAVKGAAGVAKKGVKLAGKGAMFAGAGAKGALDGFKERGSSNNNLADFKSGSNESGNSAVGDTPQNQNNGGSNAANQNSDSTSTPLGSKSDTNANSSPLSNMGGANGNPGGSLSNATENTNSSATTGMNQNGGSQGASPLSGVKSGGNSGSGPRHPISKPTKSNNKGSSKLPKPPSRKDLTSKNRTAPLIKGNSSKQNFGVRMPQHLKDANKSMKESIKEMQPTPSTSNTLKEAGIEKYADIAQSVYNSPTMRQARKVYDMSKNSVMNKEGK